MNKKRILIKLTGTIFLDTKTHSLTRRYVDEVAHQIKQLHNTYTLSIVIGGGSFFRGNQHNTVGLRTTVAHEVGMIATVMNGLMLQDIFTQHALPTCSLCGFHNPMIGQPASQNHIDHALRENKIIIFSGGTGNPFVSTDTCALIRAQQIGADELWKASDVDGVYNDNPKHNPHAHRYETITIKEALDKKLNFMDHTALMIAQQESVTMRLFNVFEQNALIQAAENERHGTTVVP
jgi:uridylate kinase